MRRAFFFTSSRIRVVLLFALILALITAGAARAQVLYGSLVGMVHDSTGAVVPGGAVTVVNTGTAQSLSVTTDSTGSYSFPNLLPGSYDLTIMAKGFRSYTQKNVAVIVNTVRREDVALEVGQLTDTVTVQAAALALQTDKCMWT